MRPDGAGVRCASGLAEEAGNLTQAGASSRLTGPTARHRMDSLGQSCGDSSAVGKMKAGLAALFGVDRRLAQGVPAAVRADDGRATIRFGLSFSLDVCRALCNHRVAREWRRGEVAARWRVCWTV